VGVAETQIETLKTVRVFVEQVAQIAGGFVCRRDG